MLFACLTIGFLIGSGAAAMTLVNGGGILLALLAYGAGGAFAILAIVAVFILTQDNGPQPEFAQTA